MEDTDRKLTKYKFPEIHRDFSVMCNSVIEEKEEKRETDNNFLLTLSERKQSTASWLEKVIFGLQTPSFKE